MITTFFRVLDTAVEEKAAGLRSLVQDLTRGVRHQGEDSAAILLDPSVFPDVPGSPFAYWLTERVRGAFGQLHPFAQGRRSVKQGLATTDDFRFLRAWWEVSLGSLGRDGWAQFARSGGSNARYYGPSPMVINWNDQGAVLKALVTQRYGNAGKRIYNEDYYFRVGFCWPLRGTRLAVKAVGPDSVFGIASKMAFVEQNERDLVLGLLNSAAFDGMLRVQAGSVGGVQYEAGLLARTPLPMFQEPAAGEVAQLARRAWSLMRILDTTNETSHAFVLPPGSIGYEAVTPNERAGGFSRSAIEAELIEIQHEIDEHAFALYGFSTEDRAAIESTSKRAAISHDDDGIEGEDEVDDADESEDTRAGVPVLPLYSWLVGVAFGRFDKRLATGEREVPPEPQPFDPLPSRSRGMWPEGEPRNVNVPQVLVDDPGHDSDLGARVDEAAANTGWPAPQELRSWLAREFFPLHIKMYSKSRRKAPIYWQLATPSASYSVWLYLHAFTKDTLYNVQNDHVVLKLAHEERKLESLRRGLGESSKAAERKALVAQENFVEELRALLEEVKRVAPLWNPNLDDGVIINFAPLWRLVPHHKPWQKELKATWDALCAGDYDWAHLAMHLWPERVVPKCATDRSLAIAHGLEDVFWIEGANKKWTARKKLLTPVDELVRERTSPAVKAGLKSLLEASAGATREGRKR